MKRIFALLGAVAALGCLTGCETFRPTSQQHYTSSLMQYLYPDREAHRDKPQVPTLTLPLRVGVAFVPENDDAGSRRYMSGRMLTEEQKVKLLTQVSSEFRKYPFVSHIEVIPSAYLSPRGSFANLEQLQHMFDVDVIALVSYDQIQFTGSTRWSLAYITVIGAAFINGEENDTRTLLDAAVYDIKSRKLLFRAPGLSEIKGGSSPVNETEVRREASEKGFQGASTNLITNLEAQLASFRERIKERPDDVRIVRSPGYTGGGAAGMFEVFAVAALATTALLRRVKR